MRRDNDAAAKILAASDHDTTSLLLAAARLSRWQLPLKPLSARAESDPSIGALADVYLATVDTMATRPLYVSRHPGTIPISGQQFPWPDAPTTCGLDGNVSPGLRFPAEETALKAGLLTGSLRDVRGFFVIDQCRLDVTTVTIRVKNDGSGTVSLRASTIRGGRKDEQRALGEEEVRRLLARLDSFGLEALPAMSSAKGNWGAGGTGKTEYFRANRKGGRRLIFQLPEAALDDSGYGKAQRLFNELADTMGGKPSLP